jgi:glycerol-3-phosphate O-acyltransferase
VVATLLARMEASESLDEETCVSDALKLGRQAYLQRRISSESSIGKILFRNGFQMVRSRQLTEGGDPGTADRRMGLSRELRDLLRRLEVIRAIGVATRGAQPGEINV